MISDTTAQFLIGIVSPWFVTVLLVIVIGVVLLMLPRLVRILLKLPFWVTLFLVAIVIAGALIRFYFVPLGHRIYFDEDRYLSYAVTFARFGKATNINIATTHKLIKGVPDVAARVTVPTINAWTLRLFGYSEEVLFNAAKVWSVLQILFIFICAYILTESAMVALFSEAGIAFLPNVVYWSVSTNLDLYFVHFAILSVIAASWYGKKPSGLSTLFLISNLLLLLFVRFEGFLLMPIVLFTIIGVRRNKKLPIVSRVDMHMLIVTIPFIALRALVSLSVFGKPWCCGEGTPLETFMPGYFIRNTIPNLGALILKPEFPAVITLLAAITLINRKNWYVWICGVWFTLYFFLYSFYYAGSFFSAEFSGSYGRFFLMLVPPLLILAGISFEQTMMWVKRVLKKQPLKVVLIVTLVGISLIPTIKRYRYMIQTSPYDRIVEAETRKYHQHTEKIFVPKTPQDGILIHSLTSYTLLNGRTSVYVNSFLEDPEAQRFVIGELKKGHTAYMIDSSFCIFDPKKCQKEFKNIKFTPFTSPNDNPYRIRILKLQYKESSTSATLKR